MKTVIVAAAAVLAVLLPSPAEARGHQMDPPIADYPAEARNPVIWIEHVQRRWYWVELADNSAWMVTPCRTDEVTGNPNQTCYWNARRQGNGRGHSFVVLQGQKHRINYAMQP